MGLFHAVLLAASLGWSASVFAVQQETTSPTMTTTHSFHTPHFSAFIAHTESTQPSLDQPTPPPTTTSTSIPAETPIKHPVHTSPTTAPASYTIHTQIAHTESRQPSLDGPNPTRATPHRMAPTVENPNSSLDIPSYAPTRVNQGPGATETKTQARPSNPPPPYSQPRDPPSPLPWTTDGAASVLVAALTSYERIQATPAGPPQTFYIQGTPIVAATSNGVPQATYWVDGTPVAAGQPAITIGANLWSAGPGSSDMWINGTSTHFSASGTGTAVITTKAEAWTTHRASRVAGSISAPATSKTGPSPSLQPSKHASGAAGWGPGEGLAAICLLVSLICI